MNSDARPLPAPLPQDEGDLPPNPGAGHHRRCRDLYALAFGIFLALSLLKFGNPVILDRAIVPPATMQEALAFAWPDRWAVWLLVPLVLAGFALGVFLKERCVIQPWFWVPPITWFGWQLVSATNTVDGRLTVAAIGQFGGCLACYFSGAWLLGTRRALHWLLIGLLAAFTVVLVRAANQRLFEFPQERQLLLEGERSGWTNFAPESVERMKAEGVIVTTNGIDIANPFIMGKYAKARVHGTLVYPNALAGAVLLLWPVSIAIAFTRTQPFKRWMRAAIAGLTVLLGGAAFFWTGSKLAWLIAVALLCVWLLDLNWPRRWKGLMSAAVVIAGAVVFLVRFHGYFAAGAKSAGARLDYWRAAIQVVQERPWTGSGPGTFQRPFAEIKAPGAEMARLAHNDFLEQFSDSGIVGGLSYLAWIGCALAAGWRRVRQSRDAVDFVVFLGLAGWFLQGLGEFALYIPGVAWPAFTLLGWLTARPKL